MHQLVTYPPPLSATVPPFSQPGFLVNTPAQLALQSATGCWVVGALNTATGLLDARCAFFAHNLLAVSPKQQSFGSIEFVENLPDAMLIAFLDTLEQAVEQAGLSGLRLVHYPRVYAPRQTDRLINRLLHQNYTVVDEQRNFHIHISGKLFTDNLHTSTARRLQKSLRAGLTGHFWPDSNIDDVISFIENSRRCQGYVLTIDPVRLRYLLTIFPDDYLVFAVFDQHTIAAATVAVRIRTDILYNFLPADNADYRSFSPAILLTQCLYEYGQQHQFRLLDLGICVDEHRQPKPDLMRFKRNLGAEESSKLSWQIMVSAESVRRRG